MERTEDKLRVEFGYETIVYEVIEMPLGLKDDALVGPRFSYLLEPGKIYAIKNLNLNGEIKFVEATPQGMVEYQANTLAKEYAEGAEISKSDNPTEPPVAGRSIRG